MIEPLLYKYAETNGIEFIHKDVNDATPEEIEWAGQLPVIFFWDERVEFDEALARIAA